MTLLLLLVLTDGQDVAARFEKALRSLDADDFQSRQAAAVEIEGLPAEALPIVEAALKRPGLSVEARTRLEGTLPALRRTVRRAATVKKAEAALAWSKKTVADAYEKAGRRDPKWDAPAREALRVVSVLWADGRADVADPMRHVYDQAEKAVAAGCDDPMILYVRARMYDVVIRKDAQVGVRLHVEAAKAMKERGGAYHAMRRALPYLRAGEFLGRSKKQLSDEEKKEALGWLEASLGDFAEAVKDPEVPDVRLFEFGEATSTSWKTLTKDRNPGFDRAVAAIAKARPESRIPDLLVGRVYVEYAWDARGSGWASSVTEEGWKRMKERLAVAEAALARAYEKDPLDPEAPTQMLAVELGQGKGRETMELWYRRAMAADPDNRAAANKKMYYLEPKWHGNAEAMLDYGRELLKAGNWRALLPFELVDAHFALARYEKDQAAYWRKQEVWEDVRAVYEGALAQDPKNDFQRSEYAKTACQCGRWAVAKREFDLLGDRVRVDAFKDKAELDRLRAEAKEKAR